MSQEKAAPAGKDNKATTAKEKKEAAAAKAKVRRQWRRAI